MRMLLTFDTNMRIKLHRKPVCADLVKERADTVERGILRPGQFGRVRCGKHYLDSAIESFDKALPSNGISFCEILDGKMIEKNQQPVNIGMHAK